ncbi:MAG: cysteine--tRNA ligase [Planctomycetota bacterium]
MPLSVYNTRTRTKELFRPAHARVVRIYTCGLTVYDPMHIGHARTYCFWDTFRRYLEYRGFHVVSVINYTDIDDRIMERSDKSRGCMDVAEAVIARFREDCRALHLKDYAAYTRATDFVADQIEMVRKLIEKGHAYVVNGEVFYDVTSFEHYGELSRNKLDEQEVGASGRVGEDVSRKRHPADFTLWKPSEEGQPSWPTGHAAWPSGRPGWHIECSAMSGALLGDHFDVHGGAVDNLFPHHENEVAQSEVLFGRPWVTYWLHPEHLDLRGEKMSKSLGNVVGVPELLAANEYDEIRWFFAAHHYRSKLPYSKELLEQSVAGYRRIARLFSVLEERLDGFDVAAAAVPSEYASLRSEETAIPRFRARYEQGSYQEQTARFLEGFVAAMDDDLNGPKAVAALFDYVNGLYAAGIEHSEDLPGLLAVYRALARHLSVFGIERARPALYPELCAEYAQPPALGASGRGGDQVVDRLLEMRQEARERKDFAQSDTIRDLMKEAGVEVEDTPEGSRWSV